MTRASATRPSLIRQGKSKKHLPTALLWGMLLCVTSGCLADQPEELTYTILRQLPHDPQLFTQGLITQRLSPQELPTQETLLVESAGGYGRSSVRRYNPATGALLSQARFPANVFAEGIAQVDDQLLVLTWREGVTFRLDAESLKLVAIHKFDGEGWGLTFDGRELIMSDGSDSLTRRDPGDFSVLGRLRVRGSDQHWTNLNELEFADGYIWANIWQDHRIIAIDPGTGVVKGVLDLSRLVELNSTRPGHSVLNGIAWDSERDAFWITGKLWPRLYLIKVEWPSPETPE